MELLMIYLAFEFNSILMCSHSMTCPYVEFLVVAKIQKQLGFVRLYICQNKTVISILMDPKKD